MSFELTVWDFDGVLNRNVIDGRFIWADNMLSDLNLDPEIFTDFMFKSHRIGQVIRGQRDLLDVSQAWLKLQETEISATKFLDYWFEKDALPDAEVTDWLVAVKGRKVIGTNNETRRVSFIEKEMGYGRLVEHCFSSGRLGVAKPDVAFWRAVEKWSGLAPDQILLIDDCPTNIASAMEHGWHTFHFTEKTRGALPGVLGIQ